MNQAEESTVSPRFYGLIQTEPCVESEKVRTLKIWYNTVLYCTVNSLYCLAHILIGYNMVQYAYIVYMRVKYVYTCNRVQYNINPKTAVSLLGGLAVNCCMPSGSALFLSLKLLFFCILITFLLVIFILLI